MGNEDSQVASNPEQYKVDRFFEKQLFSKLDNSRIDKYL